MLPALFMSAINSITASAKLSDDFLISPFISTKDFFRVHRSIRDPLAKAIGSDSVSGK